MAVPHGGFGRRLAIAFALVAAVTAGLVASILYVVWDDAFATYVHEKLQQTAEGTAGVLGRSYEAAGGWTLDAFGLLPSYTLTNSLALQVITTSGDILYDDTLMRGRMRQQMQDGLDDSLQADEHAVMAPVIASGETVGYVKVWSYGPQGLLTENDLRFRRASFTGLAVAALLAVALGGVGGLAYSASLVRPVTRITEAAAALRAGDPKARTGLSGEDEIGLLGTTFDEMADSIEADRAMERRLTADVAHELRTPLQAIQATVEAMQDGVLPTDNERLSVVRDETVRLARLADGILELTRLERGSVPFLCEPLDVADAVQAAVDTHRVLIEGCGLLLTQDLEPGVRVKGDRDRIQQAFGNLLANAARYTPEGGRIEVMVRREGDRALIEVADTGIGIAEDDLQRVFSRFWRADKARESSSGGLGIGLAVVKEIVERHGGVVGASRRESGGSVFSVRLPLAPTV